MTSPAFNLRSWTSALHEWPLDKQLTLLFPGGILLFALLFGDIRQWQPGENKAALTGAGIFFLLIALIRLALARNVLSTRYEWLLRELWPVPAILLGYLLMRLLRLELAIDALGIKLMDPLMIAFDTALFGQPLPLLIQHWVSPAMTLLMESAYLHFYYTVPIGSLLWLFYCRPEQPAAFILLRQGIIYTLVAGWLMYLLVPVIGPGQWLETEFSVSLGPQDGLVYDAVNSFRYVYDCFPSLHTAVPWITLLLCWRWYSWPLRILVLAMTLSITLSTLYLRYHYAADVLGGILLAVIVARILSHQQAGTLRPALSAG